MEKMKHVVIATKPKEKKRPFSQIFILINIKKEKKN
jgi:hypothetical protein